MLANENAFVIAEQFSHGKEIREQEYYFETMAMFILISKWLGQSPSHKSWISTKCKTSLEQGWPNCGSRGASDSSNLCMRLFELSENLNICFFLWFISAAKCRNIVKWYCSSQRAVQYYFCKSFQQGIIMSQKRKLQINSWFYIFTLRLFVTWVSRYAAHT